MTVIQPATRRVVQALFAYVVFLALLVLPLTQAHFRDVFSERGPFELLSPPLWLLLAAWCLDPQRRPSRPTVACGVLALLAAARECDWDREFTADSIFKMAYYSRAVAPLWEKIPAAVVTLGCFALIIYLLVIGVRLLRRPDVAREAWLQIMVVGAGTLVASKLLDRAINSIDDWTGFHIGGLGGRMIGGFEEGLEFALPIVFSVALFQYRAQHARRS